MSFFEDILEKQTTNNNNSNNSSTGIGGNSSSELLDETKRDNAVKDGLLTDIKIAVNAVDSTIKKSTDEIIKAIASSAATIAEALPSSLSSIVEKAIGAALGAVAANAIGSAIKPGGAPAAGAPGAEKSPKIHKAPVTLETPGIGGTPKAGAPGTGGGLKSVIGSAARKMMNKGTAGIVVGGGILAGLAYLNSDDAKEAQYRYEISHPDIHNSTPARVEEREKWIKEHYGTKPNVTPTTVPSNEDDAARAKRDLWKSKNPGKIYPGRDPDYNYNNDTQVTPKEVAPAVTPKPKEVAPVVTPKPKEVAPIDQIEQSANQWKRENPGKDVNKEFGNHTIEQSSEQWKRENPGKDVNKEFDKFVAKLNKVPDLYDELMTPKTTDSKFDPLVVEAERTRLENKTEGEEDHSAEYTKSGSFTKENVLEPIRTDVEEDIDNYYNNLLSVMKVKKPKSGRFSNSDIFELEANRPEVSLEEVRKLEAEWKKEGEKKPKVEVGAGVTRLHDSEIPKGKVYTKKQHEAIAAAARKKSKPTTGNPPLTGKNSGDITTPKITRTVQETEKDVKDKIKKQNKKETPTTIDNAPFDDLFGGMKKQRDNLKPSDTVPSTGTPSKGNDYKAMPATPNDKNAKRPERTSALSDGIFERSMLLAKENMSSRANSSPTVVNAPTTLNNNTTQTNIQSPIRNQESTINKFLESRYA